MKAAWIISILLINSAAIAQVNTGATTRPTAAHRARSNGGRVHASSVASNAARLNGTPSHLQSARNPAGSANPPSTMPSHEMTKRAFIQYEVTRSKLPIRPPVVGSPGIPVANVRHHGSNPAVIGGPVSSSANKNGALDGSTVKRRP